MSAFVRRFPESVLGVLNGFDRLVFRGTLRQLSYPKGIMCLLSANHVLLKDFGSYADGRSSSLIDASLQGAKQAGREVRYLPSSRTSKEEVAQQIAARDGITSGLICVLSCVEPCCSFEVYKNKEQKRLELVGRQRKCLHLYHYFQHPTFGFMHARIQTWLPFAVQVCLNGREWLSRQMDTAGLAYKRRDNTFTWVEDVAAAQALLEEQLRVNWPELLAGLLGAIHPLHPELLGRLSVDYYWSVHQSEWASDLMFADRAQLEALYPRLVRHALTCQPSSAVMRFLGKRLLRGFAGEVVSDADYRVEGVRVKHRVNGNSVKMYDKGSVLRVETTINETEQFKVYRSKEGQPEGQKEWLPLRRGIADLQRRAQISQRSNERYQEALAAVSLAVPLKELVGKVCQRATEPGGGKRKVRGLNPFAEEDAALLEAVSRPEWCVNGLRNRDLVELLYKGKAKNKQEKRRRSAKATRLLRLLRGHGLIRKVAGTHRYQVTPEGRTAITALLAARNADVDFLTSHAA